MKIRPVGAKLFHADGWTGRQTDRHDNFANLPNNITLHKLVVFQSSIKGHTLQGMLNRARLPALTAQTSMPVNILKIIQNKKDTHEVALNGTEFLSSLDYTMKGGHHCLHIATDDSIHSAMIGPVTK